SGEAEDLGHLQGPQLPGGDDGLPFPLGQPLRHAVVGAPAGPALDRPAEDPAHPVDLDRGVAGPGPGMAGPVDERLLVVLRPLRIATGGVDGETARVLLAGVDQNLPVLVGQGDQLSLAVPVTLRLRAGPPSREEADGQHREKKRLPSPLHRHHLSWRYSAAPTSSTCPTNWLPALWNVTRACTA